MPAILCQLKLIGDSRRQVHLFQIRQPFARLHRLDQDTNPVSQQIEQIELKKCLDQPLKFNLFGLLDLRGLLEAQTKLANQERAK